MGDSIPIDVDDFLQQFKALLRFHPDACSWIGRDDQLLELENLGLTFFDAERLIVEVLSVEHHHRGPEPDDHAPQSGMVNIFRCPVPDHRDAYVKISLRLIKSKSGARRGVIWSFKAWQESSEQGTSQ